jgi:hypothetical protein
MTLLFQFIDAHPYWSFGALVLVCMTAMSVFSDLALAAERRDK